VESEVNQKQMEKGLPPVGENFPFRPGSFQLFGGNDEAYLI